MHTTGQLPRAFQGTLVGHGKLARGVKARAEAFRSCKLVGVGSSIPETVLSNDDLSAFVDTNDEWIATRTGIRRRHVLAQGEDITSHASASASAALNMAGIAGADVDMVILATSSPDDVFGSATQVRSHFVTRF
jgi:3-oxoacyl-[acyl-carrier-protein] synthase-3